MVRSVRGVWLEQLSAPELASGLNFTGWVSLLFAAIDSKGLHLVPIHAPNVIQDSGDLFF